MLSWDPSALRSGSLRLVYRSGRTYERDWFDVPQVRHPPRNIRPRHRNAAWLFILFGYSVRHAFVRGQWALCCRLRPQTFNGAATHDVLQGLFSAVPRVKFPSQEHSRVNGPSLTQHLFCRETQGHCSGSWSLCPWCKIRRGGVNLCSWVGVGARPLDPPELRDWSGALEWPSGRDLSCRYSAGAGLIRGPFSPVVHWISDACRCSVGEVFPRGL